VHVVHGAEKILGLLQPGDEGSDPRSTAPNRLDQVAEPLDAYPGRVPFLEVCRFAHPLKGIAQLPSLLLNQFPGHLSKRQLLLPAASPDLDAESAQPVPKCDSHLPESTADLGGSRADGLFFAPFQPSDQPE
jgi:hypothetical protein